MMKKNIFIVGLCVCAMSSMALANANEDNQVLKYVEYEHKHKHKKSVDKEGFRDGFYIGGSLGAQWAHPEWNGSNSLFSYSSAAGSSKTLANEPHGDKDHHEKLIGRALLGYQLVNSRLYLGLEVAGTFFDTRNFHANNSLSTYTFSDMGPGETASTDANSTTYSVVTLNGNELDIDLKPGILINDNLLLYARVGAAFNELKIKETNNVYLQSGVSSSVESTNASVHSSRKDNVVGYRVGAGVEYLVMKNLGVTLDYIYTDYGSIDTRVHTQTATSVGDIASSASSPDVSVSTQSLMLGLNYHF